MQRSKAWGDLGDLKRELLDLWTEERNTVTRNGSAERMRRYRERKRQGVVCVAQVPVYALDVEMLVTRNRLKPEHESHPAKIVEAVEALVDDFTEGKLVTAGDGQRRKG